jgi:hypothetical protein
MPFVKGFLQIRGLGHPDQGLPGHEGAVDPDYGFEVGGHPGNALPGAGHPGNALPAPPPGMWPPPSSTLPIAPAPPGTPPGAIWPRPGVPPHPGHGLPGGGHISGQPVPGGGADNTLPGTPGTPGHDLPSKVYWMIAYCPALGWNYVAVDPSLDAGMPLPPAPTPKAKG